MNPVGTNKNGTDAKLTLDQRGRLAGSLQFWTDMDPGAAEHLADVCMVLVDGGWADAARAVLASLMDDVSAEETWAAIMDRPPAAPDQPGSGAAPTYLRPLRSSQIPAWATFGMWSEPGGTGRRLFGRELLDLREAADPDSPHLRILAVAAERGRPTMALQVSEAGTPIVVRPDDACRVLDAVTEAVRLSRRHGSGRR